MKKHLVLIVNIVLILAILGGIFYAMYRASLMTEKPETQAQPSQAPVATVDEPTTPAVIYDIGIIQNSDEPDMNSVYQGFIAELAAKGYVNQSTINLHYVLEEDEQECEKVIDEFIKKEYDLIFTIGPTCTKLAASMNDEIPIVFAAVQEPEQEEYVKSNEAPGGNVTGVSDYTPCFEQIDSIKMMFPDAKKIGAVYLATNADSVTQALIGEKEAKTEGVNIPYEKYPVKDKDDFANTLDEMLEDGVDVVYAPVDKFVKKHIKTLVDFSYDNNIPVVCGDTAMLKKGCFSTCVINYPSIGGEAGEMALNILNDSAYPATTPIAYIYDCYLHINEKAMNKLDLSLPQDVLDKAIIE